MNNVLMVHMGEHFKKLSPLLQYAHTGHKQLQGKAEVIRGNALAHLICSVFKFPKASSLVNLTVECLHAEHSMQWKRNFDGLNMQSSFSKQGQYLVEHLGPLDILFFVTL